MPLNMSTLHTLTSKVTSRGHFNLTMLANKFCSLGRSFMSIAKYFRYKEKFSGEGEGVQPLSLATEGLQNVGLKNVWQNIQNHFCHLWQFILKMLHSIYREFQKNVARNKSEKCSKTKNLEILILYFSSKFILFVFIWYIKLLKPTDL